MAQDKRRFATRVSVNEKMIETLYKKMANIVDNYKPLEDKAELEDVVKTYCQFLYIMIENSDFKETLISKSDEVYLNLDKFRDKNKEIEEDMRQIINTRLSEQYRYIKYDIKRNSRGKITINDKVRQMFEQSDSNDVVTRKYKYILSTSKKNDNTLEDVCISNAVDSNNVAHRFEEEIESLRAAMDFTTRERRPAEFKSVLDRAGIEWINNPDYTFDYKVLNEKLDKSAADIDTQKAEALIKSVIPDQEVDLKFMRQFFRCLKYRQCENLFFNLKQKSIESLALYQKSILEECKKEEIENPYEEGLLKYKAGYVKDERMLDGGKTTIRFFALLNDYYEDTIKFNNSISTNSSYIKNLGDETRLYDDLKMKIAIRDAEKMQNRPRQNNVYTMISLSDSRFTNFHLSKEELVNFKKKHQIDNIQETDCPLINQYAFKAAVPMYIAKNKNDSKITNKVYGKMMENCENNREKFNDDEKKFNDENNLSNYVYNYYHTRGEI